MKLNEITMGSKQHAELIAQAREMAKPTIGSLVAALKDGNTNRLSQKVTDELLDALEGIDRKKKITQHDIDSLHALTSVDMDDLLEIANFY